MKTTTKTSTLAPTTTTHNTQHTTHNTHNNNFQHTPSTTTTHQKKIPFKRAEAQHLVATSPLDHLHHPKTLKSSTGDPPWPCSNVNTHTHAQHTTHPYSGTPHTGHAHTLSLTAHEHTQTAHPILSSSSHTCTPLRRTPGHTRSRTHRRVNQHGSCLRGVQT